MVTRGHRLLPETGISSSVPQVQGCFLCALAGTGSGLGDAGQRLLGNSPSCHPVFAFRGEGWLSVLGTGFKK